MAENCTPGSFVAITKDIVEEKYPEIVTKHGEVTVLAAEVEADTAVVVAAKDVVVEKAAEVAADVVVVTEAVGSVVEARDITLAAKDTTLDARDETLLSAEEARLSAAAALDSEETSEDNADQTETDRILAEQAAEMAAGSANFKGEWVADTPYPMPSNVFFGTLYYNALVALPDLTLSPDLNPDEWQPQGLQLDTDDMLMNTANPVAVLGVKANKTASSLRTLEERTDAMYARSEVIARNIEYVESGIRSKEEVTIKENHVRDIISWQTYEALAETVRQTSNSGLMLTAGLYSTDLTEEVYQHPADLSYAANLAHVHANYAGMPGTGRLAFNANGYVGRTRHNDYLLTMPKLAGGDAFETELSLPPAVPDFVTGTVSTQVTLMQGLFNRFKNKTLAAEEKQYFNWEMAYIEVYWKEVDFDEKLTDNNPSFRHGFRDATPLELQLEIQQSFHSGKKGLLENILNMPMVNMVNENGVSVTCVMQYRILSKQVPSFDGKTCDEIMEYRPDNTYAAKVGFTDTELSNSAKFRIKDLDGILADIPSLGGYDEFISDIGTVDLTPIAVPVNKARYHREYSAGTDAMGLRNFVNGWNDPVLITAFTKTPHVHRGVSYLIPVEMVLRTPLEEWNPHGIAYASTTAIKENSGTVNSPYVGWNENNYNLKIPDAFFTGQIPFNEADTKLYSYTLDSQGTARPVRASGIYVSLPPIGGGVDDFKIRHSIYFASTEYSPANVALEAMKDRLYTGTASGISSLGAKILELGKAQRLLQDRLDLVAEKL